MLGLISVLRKIRTGIDVVPLRCNAAGASRAAVWVSIVSAALLALCPPAHGQQVYGTINGVVTDPKGGVVPGTIVTATNEGTNAAASAKSDSVGAYVISNLQPGVYDVSTTVSGFSPYRATGIQVEIGLSTNLDVHLALAGTAEIVTVTTEAPVINTEQSVFGTDINQTAMTDLPLNAKRWSYFAVTTPGAVPDGTFGDVAFRGMGYMFDNNTVDGAANTQAFFTEEVGRTRMAYSTSMQSVQEFQVSTSNYSAEYGRAVGGVVNAITKSGTNTIHGDAYYYLRDSTIGGAYTPFATAAVPPNYVVTPIKPLNILDTFGADAGGPIVKDKLFWYFNYDEVKHDFPLVTVPTTPNDFFQTVVVAPPANGAPCAVSASSSALFSGNNAPKYTMGNILYCRYTAAPFSQSVATIQNEANAAMNYVESTTGTSPRTGEQTIFFPKLDWKPTPNNTISGSYNRVRWNSPYGVQTNLTVADSKDNNGTDFVKDDRAVANWSDLINSWASNNLRFIYSRDFEFEYASPAQQGDPISPQSGLPPQVDIKSCGFGVSGSTTTTLSCGWTMGSPYYLPRVDYPDEKRFQVQDTFTISKGRHLIKFGVDITHVSDFMNGYVSGDEYGEFSYVQLQDYLSDYISSTNKFAYACNTVNGGTTYNVPCWGTYFQTVGPLTFTVPTLETGLFVQDDWHVSPRLTLNLGLRWDYQALPSPVLPNPAVPQTTSFPSDKKDFGPRVGFAWDVTGQGRTVVRGGYGVYFGRISNEQIFDAMTQTGNPGSQINVSINAPSPTSAPNSATLPLYPNILSPSAIAAAGSTNVQFFPSDTRLPGAEEFDFVIEHQLGTNTSVSISYLGSVGRFLPVAIDTNLPAPTTLNYLITGGGPLNGQTVSVPFFAGKLPNPNFQHMVMYCSCATSYYNAMVLQFNRRETNGLQYNLSYTYAGNTDDEANGASGGEATSPNISGTTTGPVSPYNLRAENGTSNLEIRDRFVGTVVWQPPYFDRSSAPVRALLSGWVLSATEVAETGEPFMQTISGNEPAGFNGSYSSGDFTGGVTSTRASFVGKNINFLPATVNTDMKLGRIVKLHERLQTELSVEVYNLANHVNYNAATGAAYSTGISGSTPTLTYNSSQFGALTAANNGVFITARQFQFGLKVSF